MQLNDFFDYKNTLMEDILSTKEIVELINEDVDFEDKEQVDALRYTQVFPFEYIPDTIEDGRTFVCFEVDLVSVFNKTFYEPAIYIWIFSHRSKLRLPEGKGVRTDALASAISEKINGSRVYGLGELNLYQVKRFAPMTDFNGKLMTFRAVEFNRTGPNKHPVPSYRKG